MNKFVTLLNKIDYKISRSAFSRPRFQVELIIRKLFKVNKRFPSVLDIGGGFEGAYRSDLVAIADSYFNLEIKKGKNVDIVGSVYNIPKSSSSLDLITAFMVLEHLSEPLQALKECNRVLIKQAGLTHFSLV